MSVSTPYRRISITLPAHLVEAIDEMAPKNGRSALIADALVRYVESDRRETLRQAMVERCHVRHDQDLAIAEEFYAAEEDAYERHVGSDQT